MNKLFKDLSPIEYIYFLPASRPCGQHVYIRLLYMCIYYLYVNTNINNGRKIHMYCGRKLFKLVTPKNFCFYILTILHCILEQLVF